MASLPTPGGSDVWGANLNAAIESLHLGPDTHANRPTTGLTKGTLYSCADHDLVYKWSGSAWATYDAPPSTKSARVYHSVAQSLADNTVTSLAFDSETFDTGSMHSTTTSNNLIVADRAGKWRVFGQVRFSANGTGLRNAYVRVNGATMFTGEAPGYASAKTLVPFDDIYSLASGDQIEVLARQTSGASLDVDGGVFATIFGAHYLGT